MFEVLLSAVPQFLCVVCCVCSVNEHTPCILISKILLCFTLYFTCTYLQCWLELVGICSVLGGLTFSFQGIILDLLNYFQKTLKYGIDRGGKRNVASLILNDTY